VAGEEGKGKREGTGRRRENEGKRRGKGGKRRGHPRPDIFA